MDNTKTLKKQIDQLEKEIEVVYQDAERQADVIREKVCKLEIEYKQKELERVKATMANTFYKYNDTHYWAVGDFISDEKGFETLTFNNENGFINIGYVECDALTDFWKTDWQEISKEEFDKELEKIFKRINDIV